jgi:hypothetical protein
MNHDARLLTWLPALLALVSGFVMRDCVLLASSGLLGLAGFQRRMDQDRPQHPLSAALRCLRAGLAAMLAAATLALAVIGAWLDWWQPANDSPAVAAVLLLAFSAATRGRPTVASHGAGPANSGAPVGTLLLLAGVSALAFEAYGVPLVCCAVAVAAAAFLAWRGWLLSHDEPHLLLRAAE